MFVRKSRCSFTGLRYPFLILLLLSLYSGVRAQVSSPLFAGVEKLPADQRLIRAQKIYGASIRPLDSAQAVAVLKQILEDAHDQGDLMLEAMINGFLGLYYEKRCKQGLGPAVDYFMEGLRLTQTHDIPYVEPWLAHKLGLLYYNSANYPLAFEYLLRANAAIQGIGYRNFPEVVAYIYELGLVYYEFGYYKKSISYLKTALEYPLPDNMWYAVSINNTLALAYQQLSRPDSAIYYFNKALSWAIQKKDTAWIGIISGNLGFLHYNAKEYDKALPMLQYDLDISVRYRVWESAASTMLSIGTLMLRRGDPDIAMRYADSARVFINLMENKLISYISLYRLLSRIYEKKGDISKAYKYQDSFILFRDSVNRDKDARTLAQVEAKIDTETHLAKLKLIESEQDKAIILRNAIVIALVLLIIIVLQVLYRIRQRQKNDRKIFALEKKRAEDELNSSHHQLESYVVSLREKNQLIENFREEIQKLNTVSENSSKEQDEILDKLHYTTILTDGEWIEFKRLFVKVYKDFFDVLNEKYPDLTQAETRLLALTKLKLSVNEMANMLGISADSVRKTRLRLKKKLNLPEHISLHDILD